MNGFRKELEQNILYFWKENMVDETFGGFYGKMDAFGHIDVHANKGAVMNLRILWTYSAAFRVLGNVEYRNIADRAYKYVRDYFVDKVYGGVYWELDYQGNPYNRKKQLYAQAFALYAFSEYYRATGFREALDLGKGLFDQIEACRDHDFDGYWEAFAEDWTEIEDMRLSEKDENEGKTMNTHLHIMEAYTNFLRIDQSLTVKSALQGLVDIFIDRIYDARTGHLRLFFDKNWAAKSDVVSYGHDIEAVWLLLEAAKALGDAEVLNRCMPILSHIAEVASEGLLPDGGVAYAYNAGYMDKERHWWVQAEAVVGYMYAGRLKQDRSYTLYAEKVWQYIQDRIVDRENGEWHWSRLEDGSVNMREDKAGFWKCPYHNGRMCLEMIEHFELE